jgi:hypothetical protein
MVSYQFENEDGFTLVKEFTWVNTNLIKKELEIIINKYENKFTWEIIDSLYCDYLSKLNFTNNKSSGLSYVYELIKFKNKNYLLFIFFKTLLDEFDDIYDYLYLYL